MGHAEHEFLNQRLKLVASHVSRGAAPTGQLPAVEAVHTVWAPDRAHQYAAAGTPHSASGQGLHRPLRSWRGRLARLPGRPIDDRLVRVAVAVRARMHFPAIGPGLDQDMHVGVAKRNAARGFQLRVVQKAGDLLESLSPQAPLEYLSHHRRRFGLDLQFPVLAPPVAVWSRLKHVEPPCHCSSTRHVPVDPHPFQLPLPDREHDP